MKVINLPRLSALLFCAFALLPGSTRSIAEPVPPHTLFLAGDSTMAPKLAEKRPETGWGEMLQAHFDPRRLVVDNRARNGRSTRTFIAEGRWQNILDGLKPGDFVFIQFGHNDGSEHKNDRYTPPQQYRENLQRFVNEVRAADAEAVLFTPVMRRRFDEASNFFDTHGVYPGLVRSVARELDVALIDMHRDSGALLLELGPAASIPLYLILPAGKFGNYPEGLEDNTHFSPQGAKVMAAIAVGELRKTRLALADYLID